MFEMGWKHLEKACWKFHHMLKSVMHVEICNACWKLCWKHVENFSTCWKFQCVLKTTSKMFMLTMLRTKLKTVLKYKKISIQFFSRNLNNFLIWYLFQVTRSQKLYLETIQNIQEIVLFCSTKHSGKFQSSPQRSHSTIRCVEIKQQISFF